MRFNAVALAVGTIVAVVVAMAALAVWSMKAVANFIMLMLVAVQCA